MTKLAISLLFREDMEWFTYIYLNYSKYIKMDFILLVNTTPYGYTLLEPLIKERGFNNVILTEPFIKETWTADIWEGHMRNLKCIRNMNDIDYVTFFASNCAFYRTLDTLDPTVNVFNKDYFTESKKTTELHNEEYSFFLNHLGMSRPNIHKLNVEYFNPERICYSPNYENEWIHKISKTYKIVKKCITKSSLYYSQFEFLTTTKDVINKMTDLYWNNNLNKHFKKCEFVLEEIFPITYFINNGHSFFYIGFNSDHKKIENDMNLIKRNKNDFYAFKINHRLEHVNDQIIEFYYK